jgi:alpha-beta hydrolase superfamily lysophospholipase
MGQGADAAASDRPLILLGHSTGGLTLSLWAARHPRRAAALVLNSPWLEFQLSRVGREAITPMVAWGARVNPLGPLPNVDLGFYTRTIAKEFGGEWEYDHEWRPDRGFATNPAWLTAILTGHATIAAGIDVGAPVLTLVSARSTIQAKWDDAMTSSDIVLVVDDIAKRSLQLGPEVTVARLDGALHDVFLSRRPVRAAAYAAVERWLRGYSPRGKSRGIPGERAYS